MQKRFLFTGFLLMIVAMLPALAQEHRVEITPHIGYTFSEGVPVDPLLVPGVGTINEVNPTSAFSWGFDLNFLATEGFGIGFLYNEQRSTLEGTLVGGSKVEFADMKVRNYHAIFSYSFGESDDAVRPFVLGGLGATNYSPDDVQGQNIDGDTRFSTTWGGGVKAFASDNVGFRFMGRWTPTYIKSDPAGYWCSPYWGCWLVGESKYSNQFELSAGVVFRF